MFAPPSGKCGIVLFETRTTARTGDVITERTVAIEQQLPGLPIS